MLVPTTCLLTHLRCVIQVKQDAGEFIELNAGAYHMSSFSRHVIGTSVQHYELPRILLHLHDTSKMNQFTR